MPDNVIYNGRRARPVTFTGHIYLENDAGAWAEIPDFSITFPVVIDFAQVVEAAERFAAAKLGEDGYRVCCLTIRQPRGCAQHTPDSGQAIATRDLGGGEPDA